MLLPQAGTNALPIYELTNKNPPDNVEALMPEIMHRRVPVDCGMLELKTRRMISESSTGSRCPGPPMSFDSDSVEPNDGFSDDSMVSKNTGAMQVGPHGVAPLSS